MGSVMRGLTFEYSTVKALFTELALELHIWTAAISPVERFVKCRRNTVYIFFRVLTFDINKEFRFISSVAIFVYTIKHN